MSVYSAENGERWEWRERIGERVMYAMTCTHDDDDFGPGAVCVTCFANTQQVGALIEAEVRRTETPQATANLLLEVAVQWAAELIQQGRTATARRRLADGLEAARFVLGESL